MNIPDINLPRIVIIGCGFAGLKLVQQLKSKYYQVVLIDRNNYHTFQPLMYQVASSGLEPDSIVYPIRKLFRGKKNFHFRMAEVEQVDITTKRLMTNIGTLKYDKLVIATGATTNFFGLKNIERHGYTMKSLRESLDLRSIILQNFEKAVNTQDVEKKIEYMNFVIVGGGATGVELAGALAELKNNVLPNDYPDLDIKQMNIHIIEASDRILAGMSPSASSKSKQFLEKLGVNILLNTFVQDYDGTTAKTSQGPIKTNTLIWAAGVKGCPIKNLDKSLTPNLRIQTNAFHEVEGYPDIFAIGDVASIQSKNKGRGHAMLASIASQQGQHLAKNLNRVAKGKPSRAFVYKDRGTMATIGRNRAVVDLPFFKFSGIFAWFIWMFLHLMLLVEFRNRLVVFVNWTWSYFLYDKGLRLIIRAVDRHNKKD